MVKLAQLQNTFESGELDPTLRARSDLKVYAQGAKRCRNVQRRSTGGMERRPGTYDLASVGALGRLEAFEFSDTQRYVLAFYAGGVKIYDVDGTLLQTIATGPWTADNLWAFSTSQLGDVMIVCHTDFWPRVLTRTGSTTFTLDNLEFEEAQQSRFIFQPQYKYSAPELTLSPSGSTGSITVTASSAVFETGHIGTRIRIYGTELQITARASATSVTCTVQGTIEGKLDLDPFKTQKGSNVVEVLHLFHGVDNAEVMAFSGCNDCGGVPATYFNGSKTVTIIDEHRYKFTMTGVSYPYWEDDNQDGTPTTQTFTSARLSEDGGGPNVKFTPTGVATRNWSEQAFSSVRGYPGACCFHENRLCLGGSTSLPDGVWMSNSLQFFRFDVGKGYDADSVQVAVGTEDISRIKHLISNNDLMVMTGTGEAAFRAREGEPITPSNVRVRPQSTAGCSDTQPAVFDGAVIYTQENGLSAFEESFDSGSGEYRATPISTLAAHLIDVPRSIFVSQGTSSRAEQFAFFCNTDGTLAVFHSMRAENIAGWVQWTLGEGDIISGCAMGPYVWLCAHVRGDYRLYRLAEQDLVSLDGAVAHFNAPGVTNAWTLDARVRSRTVHLVSELGYHGTMAIPANGIITLPGVPVQYLVAGDAFYPEIETLPPSIALPTGPTDGRIRRTVKSIIDFGDDTLAANVNGHPVVTLQSEDDWAGAISAVTSPFEMHHLGFDRDPSVTIGQDAPLSPWRVLSVLQEVQF